MRARVERNRVLDPLERFSEIVFGLIMVLSFTCALSVAEAGKEEVREMFVGAIGCNLAWGIIDAAFYLIACLTEHGHAFKLLGEAQRCNNPAEARELIESVMPARVAEALEQADYERIHAHLLQVPIPDQPRLNAQDWRGAIGVFLLVFLSTLPVVIPFLLFREPRFALHASNAVAIVLLFAAGHLLARYAGLRPVRTGLAMVAIGTALVALTIALGG